MSDAAAIPATQEASLAERLYPDALAAREAQLVKDRRQHEKIQLPPSDAATPRDVMRDACGLAFSGGGIRSATFCLGVTQMLAQRGRLKLFDLLSTVSGGGYCGGFLGKLIQERKDPDKAYAEIQDNQSHPINWLRESGYYLAPGGTADVWRILSLLLRNWVAIHVVLGSFLSLPFLCGAMCRRILWNCEYWRQLESFFVPGLDLPAGVNAAPFACSPWIIPLAIFFFFGMFIPGALFWFTQLTADPKAQEKQQAFFTRWLAFGMMFSVGTLLIGIMDTAALWIYYAFAKSPSVVAGFGAVYAAAAAGFGWVQRVAGKLTALASKPKEQPSMFALAKIAGFVWAFLFWLLLAILGQAAMWMGKGPDFTTAAMERLAEHWYCVAATFGLVLLAVLILSRFYTFVNLSSLHHYYSSRLSRAYLGASNIKRDQENAPVNEPHDDDDCAWHDYHPHRHGGPLHILNTTLNETVSGKSQIEQVDRKGLAFALGPAGISVSGVHHALWLDSSDPEKISTRTVQAIPVPAWDRNDSSTPFHIFPLDPDGRTGGRAEMEELQLGDWIGISGAAFSTGMGAQTTLGLSLMLGFANVRLGYWWDSGIEPQDRPLASRVKKGAIRMYGEFITSLFPTPMSLVEELFAHFHGPARRHWYLSDGGHYENTACYELLRRRVGFILCIDCGQDDAMTFEDIGGLVRKARIDFNAEIEFVGNEPAPTFEQANVGAAAGPVYSAEKILDTLGLPQVPEAFKDLNPEWIGFPREFISLVVVDGKPIATTGERHAMLARVYYDGCDTPGTVILFIKPSLTGDEPLDVRQYHAANPEFPQQTTMDQFFDESQWESYRRLGAHIADKLLPPRETTAIVSSAGPSGDAECAGNQPAGEIAAADLPAGVVQSDTGPAAPPDAVAKPARASRTAARPKKKR